MGVAGVFTVVDREGRVEADAAGELAEQAGAHAVEGAGPRKATLSQAGVAGRDLGGDALDTADHFVGGPAREGEQQDLARVGPLGEEVERPDGRGCWSCPSRRRRSPAAGPRRRGGRSRAARLRAGQC